MIQQGHGSEELAVEVGIDCVPAKFHVLDQIGNGPAQDFLVAFSSLLGAVGPGGGEGGPVSIAMDMRARVTDGSAGHLAFFDVGEAIFVGLIDSRKLEVGQLAGA